MNGTNGMKQDHRNFTPKGYRTRSSHEQILQMVSNGLKAIKTEVIKISFEVCGIVPHGKKGPV